MVAFFRRPGSVRQTVETIRQESRNEGMMFQTPSTAIGTVVNKRMSTVTQSATVIDVGPNRVTLKLASGAERILTMREFARDWTDRIY
jgi:hypothetical protein